MSRYSQNATISFKYVDFWSKIYITCFVSFPLKLENPSLTYFTYLRWDHAHIIFARGTGIGGPIRTPGTGTFVNMVQFSRNSFEIAGHMINFFVPLSFFQNFSCLLTRSIKKRVSDSLKIFISARNGLF